MKFLLIFFLFLSINTHLFALDLEKKQQSCDEGRVESCLELALLYGSDGAILNLAKSAQYYYKSCRYNFARACGILGWIYETGKGVEVDKERAEKYHQQACSGNILISCNYIQSLEEERQKDRRTLRSWPTKIPVAISEHMKPIEIKSTVGKIGSKKRSHQSFEKPLPPVQVINSNKARSFLNPNQKIIAPKCEEAGITSCNQLGLMYEKGKGVKKDIKKAVSYYQKACQINYVGCYNLGVMYETGQGVVRSYHKAVDYYKTTCQAEFGLACHNLAVMHEHGRGVRINYTQAKEYYGRACDAGEQIGCNAYIYLFKAGY